MPCPVPGGEGRERRAREAKGEGDGGEGVQPELRDAGVWARLPCVGRVADLHGGDLAVGRGGGKKGEEKGVEGEKMCQDPGVSRSGSSVRVTAVMV